LTEATTRCSTALRRWNVSRRRALPRSLTQLPSVEQRGNYGLDETVCLCYLVCRQARPRPYSRWSSKTADTKYTSHSPLPRIQPIAPTWRKEPFDHPDWLFDTKYDGFRAVCYVGSGRCSFVSRRGNHFTRFAALCEQVASALCHDVVSELGVDEAILDGEVIVADETGRPQFYDLLRRTRSPIYVAFDLLWLNGDDLRSLPLRERREQLKTILPPGSPSILEAVSVERRGRELFHLMCTHDLEGIVAKRLSDPYEPRVRWLKIKNPDYSQKEGRADLFNAPPRRSRDGYASASPGGAERGRLP
jgi:bifunctional non-homologous end joining protein LigD